MFELFRFGAEWWIVALLILMLLGPVVFYLNGPWIFRRDEILNGLSAPSKKQYFNTFHIGLEGTLALIRSRGHLPRGGYDVQNGIKQARPTYTTTVL